tara:strand:- start:1031 stop:1798 length:768 start_codon:yes stop_codon:yes gene_type:complete
MKLKNILFTFVMVFTGLISANNHSSPYVPTNYAMEALQCNFSDGKDMDDVMKVLEDWKDISDENQYAYNAWTLTPLYYSESDVPFDFGWMGYTPNMEEMGRVQDSFQEVGQSVMNKWNRVTDCSGQSLFRVFEARAPQNEFTEGQIGYMSISSCSLIEGKTADDLEESDKVWNAYNDKNGFSGGVYRWWPGPGTPTDADFDFYLAIGFESVEQMGRGRDMRMEGMINDTRPESILNCDTPRVYQTQNIRLVTQEG